MSGAIRTDLSGARRVLLDRRKRADCDSGIVQRWQSFSGAGGIRKSLAAKPNVCLKVEWAHCQI